MQEKVLKLGIKREPGYLYFWDWKKGEIHRVPISLGGRDPKSSTEKVAMAQAARDPNYLYFIDSEGDLSRAPND